MANQITDRLTGSSGNLAKKAPVKAGSTGDLTLTGEQTVDGVALVKGDRILVKDQSTAAENGIYIVNDGTWARAKDWDGDFDVTQGTTVRISQGTNGSGKTYAISTADPINIGTTAVTLVLDTTGAGSVGDMILGDVQNVNAEKNFDSGAFKLNGATSGATILNATAIASGTLTLPAATDTLVGKATTDTLTNKTIDADGTGNVISNIDIGNAIAASQAEAELGTDNTKLVTPLRVAQAIAALETSVITNIIPHASYTVSGGETEIEFVNVFEAGFNYRFVFSNCLPSADAYFYAQTSKDGGLTYLSSSGDYWSSVFSSNNGGALVFQGNTAAQLLLSHPTTVGSRNDTEIEGVSGTLISYDPAYTGNGNINRPRFTWDLAAFDGVTQPFTLVGGGCIYDIPNGAQPDTIKFFWSTGTFEVGTITVFRETIAA